MEHLKTIILPNLAPDSHLRFDISRSDTDTMVQELFIGCGGTEVRGARFREVAQILERCNDLIQESIDIREQHIQSQLDGSPPAIRKFDVALIREAVRRSKRRSAQAAKPAKPKPPATPPEVQPLVPKDEEDNTPPTGTDSSSSA